MAEKALINTFSIVRKVLWNILFTLSYPIITTFSLIFVGILLFFSSLSKLLTGISSKMGREEKLTKPTWTPLTIVGKYSIERLYVDDVIFGPTYFRLKSSPTTVDFNNSYFGDFFFECFGGVLLQKWNNTTFNDDPNFSLVFFASQTGKLLEIEKIKSFSWNAIKVSDREVIVKWFNGTDGGQVKVSQEIVIAADRKQP